jgi:hypothetical protein
MIIHAINDEYVAITIHIADNMVIEISRYFSEKNSEKYGNITGIEPPAPKPLQNLDIIKAMKLGEKADTRPKAPLTVSDIIKINLRPNISANPPQK